MAKTRLEVKNALISYLEPINDVIAVWEGGSAATGFVDNYSDLDVTIVTTHDPTDPIFKLIDEHFESQYCILRKYRVPEPTWHHMSQCFYLLNDTEELFYADIAVVHYNNPVKFTETDRHGNAIVAFDKQGVFMASDTPTEEIEKLCKRVYAATTSIDFVIILELRKAIARNNWIASHSNYLQLVSRLLISLLNIKHRPQKADFGIRYIDRDYPVSDYELISDLLKVCSVKEIKSKTDIALMRYQDLVLELQHKYQARNT